jgi:hypothetical protein
VTWANSRLVRDFDPRAIESMKNERGGDMMIFGSGSIASLLTQHGLIDEYLFAVSPILLGGGRTLLTGVAAKRKLDLLEEKRFPSGKVLLRYERSVLPETTPVPQPAAKARPAPKKPNAELLRPDSALAKAVGSQPMSRMEITKKLWAYIKRKGLQDKKNRRMINADDVLRPVFGGESQVNMADLPSLVDKHIRSKGPLKR